MASALAIVALAGWLQWFSVSMGVAPKAYTENVRAEDAVPAALSPGAGQSGETRAEPAVTDSGQGQEPSHLDLYLNQPEIPESSTLREIRTVHPEPVATVAAVQFQGGTTLSPDELRAVLRLVEAPEAWVEPLTAIALCESHGRTGAIGDGGNSLGPWQMWYGWARPMGYQPDDLHDPIKAAETAVYIRTVRGRFGGAGGWTCADLLGIP